MFQFALPRILLCSIVFTTLPAICAEPSDAQLRDLDSHSPFSPPSSLDTWEARAAELKLQLRVSLGMFPTPELDPIDPQIYGRMDRDGYTIEKVVLETLPGFYVTGNLYRPDQIPAGTRVPGVLCPHGHWSDARFYEASPAEVKQLLATGAERFETAAMNHIQARCVQLARMGCIVFHWDMIGYCDSQQINFERAHRFARQESEDEVTEAGWLLFSPRAESHAQSIMGLQTLASFRAVDLLMDLPEVDPDRIAITGASGGGTQSFVAAALDPRIKLAFPAVMVSTGMQGGCTCENASLLRVGTGNVEMAALIAPRPLGLTAADDWTKNMASDGFPQLQQLYGLYQAKDRVALFPAVHFGHNFNHVSRTALYGWINQHFGLAHEAPVLESEFELARKDELSVWDAEHPQPAGGDEFERQLMSLWASIVQGQMTGLLKGDRHQAQELADTLDKGWRVCLGLTTLDYAHVHASVSATASGGHRFEASGFQPWALRPRPVRAAADNSRFGSTDASRVGHDQPVLDVWKPVQSDLHLELVTDGSQEGTSVYYPELEGQTTADKSDEDGEHVFLQTVKQPLVPNPRLAAAYTYGYNLPLFATRAQQLGLSIHWLLSEFPDQQLILRGRGSDAALAAAGLYCAQSIDLDGQSRRRVQLDLAPGDFAFARVADIRDPNFLPGSARFFDLPGLLAALRSTKIQLEVDDPQSYTQLQRIQQIRDNHLELEPSAAPR